MQDTVHNSSSATADCACRHWDVGCQVGGEQCRRFKQTAISPASASAPEARSWLRSMQNTVCHSSSATPANTPHQQRLTVHAGIGVRVVRLEKSGAEDPSRSKAVEQARQRLECGGGADVRAISVTAAPHQQWLAAQPQASIPVEMLPSVRNSYASFL